MTRASQFHEGERAVQRRAGTERVAAQVSRNLTSWVSPAYAQFLRRQPFVIVASRDPAGRIWVSLLAGGPGFATALDARRLLLGAMPADGDPLAAALEQPDAALGLLAIEFHTRARIRLNGVARRTPEGIVLTVHEAFGNCPKYIQRRLPDGRFEKGGPSHRRVGTALDPDQARLVSRADTFFIASAHPGRGADASHRGGRPGFAEVSPDGRELLFPDYSGNRMFQTLGNLAVDSRVGLLFVDWEAGTTLQVSGRAQIVWDGEELAARPGAERLVHVTADAVTELGQALVEPWRLIEPSRLNPPVK